MIYADLPAGATVFLDASVFIHHFEPNVLFGPAATEFLERIENQELNREAGTYGHDVPLSHPTAETTALTLPADAAGKTIHVVLEVADSGSPALNRYRRAVIRIGR